MVESLAHKNNKLGEQGDTCITYCGRLCILAVYIYIYILAVYIFLEFYIFAQYDKSRKLSVMLSLLASAPLALRTPPPVSTRRGALIAASGLAATASILPAFAGLPFDPIGAYGKMGPGPMGPPGKINGQPNTGIILLREAFDGALPEEGLLAWYEEHLAADFKATFAGGKVVLDRQASPLPQPDVVLEP